METTQESKAEDMKGSPADIPAKEAEENVNEGEGGNKLPEGSAEETSNDSDEKKKG